MFQILQGIVYPRARAFRAVPYAAPPVGAQRWKDPLPPQKWSGVKQGFKDGNGCTQECGFPKGSHACPETSGEDCLLLTIWTPRLSALSKPVPIMVFLVRCLSDACVLLLQ